MSTPLPRGMSAADDMAAAHSRDSRDERRLRDLARTINDFLADPPTRLSNKAQRDLKDAARQLCERADHIVAVWD